MSFTLTNVSKEFVDLMNRVFRNYLNAFVIVFIDYILVYSKSEGDYMDHFKVILQILKEHRLFAKYRKCEFWLRSVPFLGHIISSEDIEVDPKKIEAVKNWPRFLAPIVIRSFLGVDEFYRRFVDGFASIDSPLTILTRKSVKFEWSEACEKSSQVLKDRLNSTLVLTLSEGTNNFLVYCDASRVGLGCVLKQHGKVVVYASRKLKVYEKNYPTHDLALAVVVFSLEI